MTLSRLCYLMYLIINCSEVSSDRLLYELFVPSLVKLFLFLVFLTLSTIMMKKINIFCACFNYYCNHQSPNIT